ncbi:ATP-binding protein [Streptomyces wuyuanensis]|uniref:ATP-binding protein n=1 Tax=Streptomyces wuyuanensis TaxID=1196353 RepID=UPI003435E121
MHAVPSDSGTAYPVTDNVAWLWTVCMERDRADGAESLAAHECREAVVRVLDHRPDAAWVARRIAREALGRWRVGGEATGATVLVLSELVTNAVQHALPRVVMHVCYLRGSQRLCVGVTDGGPAHRPGQWNSSRSEDECGRGLRIVRGFADAHGVRCHASGTTRWARISAV